MLQINLFHEQQQLQREKDFDPIRLTVLAGILIVMCISVWALLIFWNSKSLRQDLASNKAQLERLSQELKALEPHTDLTKIQSQAHALQTRVEYRTLFATQLDILRDVTPANCQIRFFKTTRGLKVVENTIQGRKGPIVTKKATPTLEVTFQVNVRAKDKIEVLQIRDKLMNLLHQEPRFSDWILQEPDAEKSTNKWNAVTLMSSTVQDSKEEAVAIGVFDFKVPFALKDPPKDS